MATILFSAAGAAIGGAVGGTFAGLSAAAIGRFVGATIGRAVDQRLMGQGSDVVETGRLERYRITRAAEGNPTAQLYGRMRLPGQVIWATQFQENVTTTGGGGGKGGGNSGPERREYSYSVSLAIALCEGEIGGVGRIWADGIEIAQNDLNMQVYPEDQTQLPDPTIEAVEGAGTVPAYRGTAYVVIEALDLTPYGNRIPQFSFEVTRFAPQEQSAEELDIAQAVQGVALIPGTGEYALATEPVYYENGPGERWSANENSPSGRADFLVSHAALGRELPNCNAVSLVVSWFGSDLRCADCLIEPKVARQEFDGSMPWQVAGATRSSAGVVPRVEDDPVYGGTPADASVVQSIQAMKAAGQDVMFYPFILMEQMEDNGLPDPWSDAGDQPKLPWRGRITTTEAPGQPGSPDGTASAEAEVDAFFGMASASDFTIGAGSVSYSGPAEWRYRRFILHYAALCAAAGGVSAFCIGSEMRSLTQIRSVGGSFPAVAQLIALAAEVRSILGPDTKISYAADWSEYFGYQPQDGSGDRYFHLDPLWADANIDFIGIDNYMPLSDWREDDGHADADWGSVYNLDYLQANIEGGEGYDWYYHSPEAEAAQIRTPITDGAHNEPWVHRYKDIRNWWVNEHHERIGGVRQSTPTAWVPQSKPIWFTEYGCAAVDKGTNQPNKFLDPKSSESSLPKYSNGLRDDFIQQQYLRAMLTYWGDTANNPLSSEYGGPMLDLSRAFVWAWDSRPYPFFPSNRGLWNDGENYARGHWLSGRASNRSLASVVGEICQRAGVTHYDVSELYGVVRGYAVDQVIEARGALQPLMLQHGFDAVERDGVLRFLMREGRDETTFDPEYLALSNDVDGALEVVRGADAETSGRIRVNFIEADGNFETMSEEAVLPDEATHAVSTSELPLTLTRSEGRQVAERWLAEARVARDSAKFVLPPSALHLGAGDLLRLPMSGSEEAPLYRIDRVEQGASQLVEAVRIEPSLYEKSDYIDDVAVLSSFVPPVPVTALFMDLPLLTGDEVPHAPHIAVTAKPWPGSVALYGSDTDSDYALNTLLERRAVVGVTETALLSAQPGLIDRGDGLQIRMLSGSLQSISEDSLLSGKNAIAIGDGTPGNWEILQFQDAELVDQNTYMISGRLRGQLGTDGVMPSVWPVGSWVVVLNGIPAQIELASSARGRARYYRYGPALRGYDDPSYQQVVHAFDGNGLRPYAPAHLRAASSAGDLAISWIRRTRIDGDSWDLLEVPLGEESESYRLRIQQGPTVIREAMVSDPAWIYTQAMQATDGLTGLYDIRVAQISARYGAGLEAVLTQSA